MKEDKYIHLALAFDQNFLTPFYVLLTSVFQNNQFNNFFIHVIATGINADEKRRIESFIQNYSSSIKFYELGGHELEQISIPSSDPRYTPANFYRLFFPLLVSNTIDKLIYLDTDIIVVGNLVELYNSELQNSPFGAVLDPSNEIRPDLGIFEPCKYFNSGVLIIDLKLWKEYQLSEKAIEFANRFPEKCKYVDQCALNAVSINLWKPLNTKFNLMGQYVPVMRKKYYDQFLKDKVVVHYNIRKPWDRFCQMRLKYLYDYYFLMSPESDKKIYSHISINLRNIFRLIRNKGQDFYYDYLTFR